MKRLMIALALSLGACSNLQTKVFKNVHKGDSETRVANLLGSPAVFGQSQRDPEATAWFYAEDDLTCGVTIKEHKVTFYFCEKDSNDYSSAHEAMRDVAATYKKNDYNLLSNIKETADTSSTNTYNATNMYFGEKK